MTNMYESFEEAMNSFEAEDRRKALLEAISLGIPAPVDSGDVNMHLHSFFSYNAENWSPTRIAWESKKAGLHAAALCDFDVLEGLKEFLDAGDRLGLRTAVHLETRAYLREFSDAVINSPGEPGVTYIMGAGFSHLPEPDTVQDAGLTDSLQRATDRNLALISRINAKLPDIAIDYKTDVLGLTPASIATERHIVFAYIHKAQDAYPQPENRHAFWSTVTGTSENDIARISSTPDFATLVRAALAKRGGIGYEAPTENSFPIADDFIQWVRSCSAIPMITWLDGTSDGESDPQKMFECLIEKGAAALNIVPDRNWNISDPDIRAIKVKNLDTVVEVANAMGLPVNIGTEMNKSGQPFADDLTGPVLSRHAGTFRRGASIMVGNTLLSRYCGFGYIDGMADELFSDTAKKNDFFEAVGELQPMDTQTRQQLQEMQDSKVLAWFQDAVHGDDIRQR